MGSTESSDESSVFGRMCVVCSFDESVVSFDWVTTAGEPIRLRCSGCGTLHDADGYRV